MGASFFLVAIAINGTVAHVVPLLTDRGVSTTAAASIMGVFGLATMAGRLLAGYLVDRIFAPFLATVFFLAPDRRFHLAHQRFGPAAGARRDFAGARARNRDRPDRLSPFWFRATWASEPSAKSTDTVS